MCISLGVTLCRVGNVGVGPSTAMNLGISARIGMDFGTYQLLVNFVILVFVFFLDKHLSGLGTIINMVGVGYLIQFFTWGARPSAAPARPGVRRRHAGWWGRCCSRWACRCT